MRAIPLLVSSLALCIAGCDKSAQEEFIAQGAHVVTAAEAKQVLAGNTISGNIVVSGTIPFAVYAGPDGRAAGVAMSDSDRGRWRVAPDGQVCIRWNNWQDKAESCNVYYRKGDVYKVFLPLGVLASIGTITDGNPKKLEVRTDREVALAQGDVALTSEQASLALSGNTFSGKLERLNGAPYQVYYDVSGKLAGKLSGSVNDTDRGVWSVKGNGELCTKWSKWNDAAEGCTPLYRNGETISSFTPEGDLAVAGVMRTGNPGKLAP